MMKKEYLILIAVIVALSAYLALHKENRDNYSLPVVDAVKPEDITGLEIARKDAAYTFKKENSRWTVTEKNHEADPGVMTSMTDAVKSLKITAMVSEAGADLRRYELDPDSRIRVTVRTKGRDPLEFDMGKTAPTYSHTFIMLKGNPSVYQADGNFRSYFNKALNDYRYKKVLEFKEASIKGLTLEMAGVKRSLTADTPEEGDTQPLKKEWTFKNGEQPDAKKISSLVSTLAFLECDRFVDAAAKAEMEKEPYFCKILIDADDSLDLTLFKKKREKDTEVVNGISSMSPEAFRLSIYRADDIIEGVRSILGLPEEEKSNGS